MATRHRYGRLFPVRVETDAARCVVRTPRVLYVQRGLLTLFLGPLVGVLIALLLFLRGIDDLDVAAPIAASLAGFFVLWGIGLMALSGALSARTEVVIDRATVRRARDGATASTSVVAGVRVRKADGWTGFHLLELVARDGSTFLICDRLPGQNAPDLAALAAECAGWLGVPHEAPPVTGASALGLSESHAAVLCYLPIQGIFLIASLWFIATERRAFVRYAARQSLLHFAFSLVMLLVVLGLGATPVVLTEHEEGALRVMAIAWLVVLLVGYAAWNLGAHVYACVQASKGRAWRMPWLRLVVPPYDPTP